MLRCTIPEGVEVRISAELIKPIVLGKKVLGVNTYSSSRYSSQDPEGLQIFKKAIAEKDIRVIDIKTRGKFMHWEFTDYNFMGCQFGMTGQWSPTIGKHPCLSMTYLDNAEWKHIYFNDSRHFGSITFFDRVATWNERVARLGWDPLNDGMHERWFNHLLNNKIGKTSKPIGQVLMDQGLFAGVGNYIRAEALYLAKMSPWRPSNTLKKEDFQLLCQAIVDVMNDSYAHQGATILTYKDAYGAEGKYSSCFKVYGQKTDPLGNKIKKENTPDGRSMHWCPAVQT